MLGDQACLQGLELGDPMPWRLWNINQEHRKYIWLFEFALQHFPHIAHNLSQKASTQIPYEHPTQARAQTHFCSRVSWCGMWNGGLGGQMFLKLSPTSHNDPHLFRLCGHVLKFVGVCLCMCVCVGQLSCA